MMNRRDALKKSTVLGASVLGMKLLPEIATSEEANKKDEFGIPPAGVAVALDNQCAYNKSLSDKDDFVSIALPLVRRIFTLPENIICSRITYSNMPRRMCFNSDIFCVLPEDKKKWCDEASDKMKKEITDISMQLQRPLCFLRLEIQEHDSLISVWFQRDWEKN